MGFFRSGLVGFAMAGVSVACTSEQAGCAGDNVGIQLPPGFCASIFADDLGTVRHITATDDGRVYAILRKAEDGHGLVALRDVDQDGRADQVERFGTVTGSGILVHGQYLFAASDTTVYRWQLPAQDLLPKGEPEVVVSGFPKQGQHSAKTLAIGNGTLFVNVGAPSNACMKQTRTKGSPGMQPCPQLQQHGGIWHFAAEQTGQQFSTGAWYATGIRNAVALAWNATANELYALQHGRDQLHQFFPDLYSTVDNAELPAEEMLRVGQGDDFGWPYCYYDQIQQRKVLSPEYGGDGKQVGRCEAAEDPIVAFPGHWGPNGLLFYTGQALPEHYRGGAFIAFHGSWNRAPEPQAGYQVMFVPFRGAEPAGSYEKFAWGFSGRKRLSSPGDAKFRPMGLAQDERGALLIAETRQGRIWRVVYTGDKAAAH